MPEETEGKAKKEDAGFSKDKKKKILQVAVERYNTARSEDKDERTKADNDVRFAINDNKENDSYSPGAQWDAEVARSRLQSKPPRPCLVMNKIPEKIDQVEGEFRQLKPTIKIKAVDNFSDPITAEIYNGIIRHIEYNSNARVAYNTAYSSVLYAGRGAWRIDIEESQDDPFENDVVINRIPDILSLTDDPNVKKLDRSDRMFCFLTEDMPIPTFEKLYPNTSLDDWPEDDRYSQWKTEKTVRVAEYWWKEPYKRTAYQVMRNGQRMTVWELKEGEEPVATKTVNSFKVHWCKMIANEIIDGPFDDFPSKYIPIIVAIGKENNVGGKQKTRGMVRFAKEPQRMLNYWKSTEAETMALASKSPWLATPKMIGTHKQQWDNSNRQNTSVLYYEADDKFPGQKPEKNDPPQMSTAYIAASQGMEQDIMSSMNIYKATLGDTGDAISGIALEKRQRQGHVGAYTYNDNFEVSLTYSAKILVDIIPKEYSNERIIRIRGEEGDEKVVPINARPDSPIVARAEVSGLDKKYLQSTDYSDYINDLSVGKYDVVATIGKSYLTQREEALDKIISLLALVPKIGEVAPDLIFGLMEIPMSEEFMARIKKLVPKEFRKLEPGEEPVKPPPPTPDQLIKMKEVELKFQSEQRKDFTAAIESIKTESETMLNYAKAEAEEPGDQYEQYKNWFEGSLVKLQKLQSSMYQPEQRGQPGPEPQGVI